MSTTTLFIACSLDGFITGKNEDISWLFTDQDYGYKQFYGSVGAVVMGRKTYETSKGFGKWPYPGKASYVISHRKGKDGRVEFLSSSVEKIMAMLKKKHKRIWLVGGANLLSQFLNHKLVDKLRIFVHPILIGEGTHLFIGIKKHILLKTIKTRKFSSGLIELEYDVLPKESNST